MHQFALAEFTGNKTCEAVCFCEPDRNKFPRHFHQIVGLNSARSIADVRLDVQNRTLKLSLEFADTRLMCLECGADCATKNHGAEDSDRFDSPLFVQPLRGKDDFGAIADAQRTQVIRKLARILKKREKGWKRRESASAHLARSEALNSEQLASQVGRALQTLFAA